MKDITLSIWKTIGLNLSKGLHWIKTRKTVLKSDSLPPKSFSLFALMVALQKWWKMLFISC